MNVLEAAAVAAHDDQVHALLVLDLEVAHGPAAGATDAEAEHVRTAALEGGVLESERQPVVRDGETAGPLPERMRRRRGLPLWVSVRSSPLRSGPTVLPAKAAAPNRSTSAPAKPASLSPTFIHENVAYPRGVSV